MRCGGDGLVASPAFDLEVHRVLVAFPIVLASEFLVAAVVGATVRAGMTLFVFPVRGVNVQPRLQDKCTLR